MANRTQAHTLTVGPIVLGVEVGVVSARPTRTAALVVDGLLRRMEAPRARPPRRRSAFAR